MKAILILVLGLLVGVGGARWLGYPVSLPDFAFAGSDCKDSILRRVSQRSNMIANDTSDRFLESKDPANVYPIDRRDEYKIVSFLEKSGFPDRKEYIYTIYRIDGGGFVITADIQLEAAPSAIQSRRRIYGASFDQCSRLRSKPSDFYDR